MEICRSLSCELKQQQQAPLFSKGNLHLWNKGNLPTRGHARGGGTQFCLPDEGEAYLTVMGLAVYYILNIPYTELLCVLSCGIVFSKCGNNVDSPPTPPSPSDHFFCPSPFVSVPTAPCQFPGLAISPKKICDFTVQRRHPSAFHTREVCSGVSLSTSGHLFNSTKTKSQVLELARRDHVLLWEIPVCWLFHSTPSCRDLRALAKVDIFGNQESWNVTTRPW